MLVKIDEYIVFCVHRRSYLLGSPVNIDSREVDADDAIRPTSETETLRGFERSYCCRSGVKIRPRKACRYPNLRSFGWVSYDKVGGLYSGKLGIRSEARASDLRSYPGLWWKRIKLHLNEGTKVSTLRGPTQLADLQGALCVLHPLI